jgi:putative intracellular protease/amidase
VLAWYRVQQESLLATPSGPAPPGGMAPAIANPACGALRAAGGTGTRAEINNAALVAWVRDVPATHKLSVCTGAALLAVAGLLQGRRATTNKLSFDWVVSAAREKVRAVHDHSVSCMHFVGSSHGACSPVRAAVGFPDMRTARHSKPRHASPWSSGKVYSRRGPAASLRGFGSGCRLRPALHRSRSP